MKSHRNGNHRAENCKVIVLGDHDTGKQVDALGKQADKHGAAITEAYTFDQNAASSSSSLVEVDAVVAAVGRAISTGADIWVPYPMPDFGHEQHVRRLSLVLQRHGINLRMGPHLWPCPTTGGMNEADFALRREVQSVDELDNAALAAGGLQTLAMEIEAVLTAEGTEAVDSVVLQRPDDAIQPERALHSSPPVMPAVPPDAPWAQRQPALKDFAKWVVEQGATQATVAEFFNTFGHRTPKGRLWTQATVSALINGRYDRPAAA